MSSARNAGFVSASQAAKILISALSLVVLSRLLPPADFGVYAMIIAVVGIGELFRDFGLSLAAIQATSISRTQRSDLFWANTGIGLVLTVLAAAASPLVAQLYDRPSLAPLVCVAALTFALNGAGAQYRVELTRAGRFKDLAIVDVLGQTIALSAAIVLAVAGFGAWALVAQAVLLSGAMLVVLVVIGRWAPSRLRGFGEIRSFLGFGGRLLSVQVISYVGQNLDKVLIGRLFGAVSLGLYSKAYVLYSQPLTQGLAPFTNLAISALSQVRDDRPTYVRRLLKLQLVTDYVGLAGFAMMIGLAAPLTAVVLGPAWSGTVPLFRILCIGGLFQIVGFVYYWMFLSSGVIRPYLVCTFITQPVAIASIAVGSLHGTVGVAWGAAAGLFFEWLLPATWGAAKAIGQARALLLNTVRPLVVAATVALVSFGVVQLTAALPPIVQLAAAAALAASAVLALMLCIPVLRADGAMLLGIVREAFGGRLKRRAAVS